MAGEADLVADFGGAFLNPGIRGVRQHLAVDEGLDAAFFQEGDLLGVVQVAVGFVFDDAGLTVDSGFVEAVEGNGLGFAGLVDLADDGRAASSRQLTALKICLRSWGGTLSLSALSAAARYGNG